MRCTNLLMMRMGEHPLQGIFTRTLDLRMRFCQSAWLLITLPLATGQFVRCALQTQQCPCRLDPLLHQRATRRCNSDGSCSNIWHSLSSSKSSCCGGNRSTEAMAIMEGLTCSRSSAPGGRQPLGQLCSRCEGACLPLLLLLPPTRRPWRPGTRSGKGIIASRSLARPPPSWVTAGWCVAAVVRGATARSALQRERCGSD